MAGYDPENVYRNWESNLFLKRMEEKTGVKFTYRQYGKEDEWTAVKAAMTRRERRSAGRAVQGAPVAR